MAPQIVPVEKFCKDHWSTFGYAESRCVDGIKGVGTLDRAKMRCNGNKRPMLGANLAWDQKWGTRLMGYFEFSDRGVAAKAEAAGLQLLDHDDWDCLDDLAAHGFIEIISQAQGAVRMTPLGNEVAAALRKHKSEGGMFADFVWRGGHGCTRTQEINHA